MIQRPQWELAITWRLETLEQVPVRDIWPHEENNFTPWLADNLYLLGNFLELNLELIQVEAELPDAGRVESWPWSAVSFRLATWQRAFEIPLKVSEVNRVSF